MKRRHALRIVLYRLSPADVAGQVYTPTIMPGARLQYQTRCACTPSMIVATPYGPVGVSRAETPSTGWSGTFSIRHAVAKQDSWVSRAGSVLRRAQRMRRAPTSL